MAKEFFGPFDVTMTDQTDELTIVGDLAVRRGVGTVTLVPKTGGPAIEETFKYLESWGRGPDGSWKITQDIFNSSKPAE